MPRRLRLATFNAENFSLLLDRSYTRQELEALSEADYQAMNTSIYNPNKERRKIGEIARLIERSRLDVVGMCEIGGRETLEAFNRLYLRNKFDTFLHEENSRRGIFVGALVRKGRFPGLSAQNMAGPFSRNLLRLDLGPGADNLHLYVVHLKSQLGADWGIGPRLKEIAWLSGTVRRERCVVMGDFNGIAQREESQFEYEEFLKLPFRDALEAVAIPQEQRRTHYHFGPEPHFTQLDYIFCSNDLTVERAQVLEGEIPLNRTQRNYLPSDHLMVKAQIHWPGLVAERWWIRALRWLRARLR